MKKYRLAALIFSSMLAASALAGCGSGTETSKSSESTDTASVSSEADDTSAADAASAEVTLPLCEEKTTLTFFQQLNQNAVVTTDYNDVEAFQELEERTNVHIEWQMSSSTDFQTNFNLMIASNQVADIMAGADYYSDGLDAGADDGYFLDLTDLIQEYAPHYYALANSNETFRVKTKTDSGRYIAIYPLMQEAQGPWIGLMIRQDWLDDLGLETPVTYDDWHTVLTEFKDEKGATAPLYLCGSGITDFAKSFMSGYGVSYDWQLTEDGTVAYGPSLDGWRKYLTTMNQWYEEGLIDQDFMTSEYFVDTAYVVTGKTGAFSGIDSMAKVYKASSEDENFELSAITQPVENEGDTIHLRCADQVFAGSVFAIGANTKNAELALRWIDYLYTDEGAILANYGIEGDTFTYSDTGAYQLTDKILNNDKLSAVQAQYSYCMAPNAAPYYYDWTRGLLLAGNDNTTNVWMDTWMEDDDDWVLPTELTLTADESTELSSIMSDIQSYMQETSVAMISGVQDVETAWEGYQDTLKSLGLERATEIKQAAYDRYLAR